MRSLLAATCLTPVALCLSIGEAAAETVVSTAVTTPMRTSTASNGTPDSIRITSAGSIKPTGGTAVTVDSNHNVTNDGTIQITGANNATGILINPGVTANISSSGTISIDEDYTASDSDNDGDEDGAFAQGSGRFGIRLGSGGALTGNVSNSGSISVEGNDSAGIQLDSRLNGSLASSGGVNVRGNNSYGIRAREISGDANITASVFAQGANTVGVAFDGDIGGALVVNAGIAATGYRYTSSPSDTSKLDADDLLQGGTALRVAGNVGKGINIDSSGSAVSYSGAAGLQIASAEKDLAIGAVSGQAQGHGLDIEGAVAGRGVYQGIAANGLVIGGLGRSVTVAGGMSVSGTVKAEAVKASAVALRISDRSVVPEIRNSGVIGASGGGVDGTKVEAIAIERGSTMRSITNSGTIEARLASGGGTAVAVRDGTGLLSLVTNSGNISATGGDLETDKAVALDLSLNTTGVTFSQTAVASGTAAPQVNGNLLLGSGNDLVDIADGTVTGNTRFGLGADRLTLSGDAVYTGNLSFGDGADALSLSGTSVFRGRLDGNGGLTVSVNGGTLDVTNEGRVALSSLTMTGKSGIVVNVGSDGHTFYDVAGQASFTADTTFGVKFNNTAASEGRLLVLRASDLVGAQHLTSSTLVLPYMYQSGVVVDAAKEEVYLDIRRKSVTELGLNGSEGAAYDAIYAALGNDEDVEQAFLDIRDGDAFRQSLRQMLPEHAGGAFETVSRASRTTTRFLADPHAPIVNMAGWGLLLQQVGWGNSKDLGDTAAYDISGWGASLGGEIKAGNSSALGLLVSYLTGTDADGSTDNEVQTDQYELSAYWRGAFGPFAAYARASGSYVAFTGARSFSGTVGDATVTREAKGKWNGRLFSAAAGLSYQARFGRLSLRPQLSLDYYTLHEDDYTETGGGDGFNLSVEARDSDEAAVNGSLTLGYDLAGTAADDGFFRVELEGGRREIVSGSLGDTVARFTDGEEFTLQASERTSGWLGRVRLIGGNPDLRISGEAGAEQQEGRTGLDFRITLQSAL